MDPQDDKPKVKVSELSQAATFALALARVRLQWGFDSEQGRSFRRQFQEWKGRDFLGCPLKEWEAEYRTGTTELFDKGVVECSRTATGLYVITKILDDRLENADTLKFKLLH